MSKNRIKIAGPLLRSRAEMETCVGNIRALTIELKTLEAERNGRIKAIDDEYQERIQTLGEQTAMLFKSAEAWSEANPAKFGAVKSIDMVHGVVGFRVGQPQLKTLPGWTFDRVLEKLKSVPVLRCFVREKLEVDKQAIIAARGSLDEETLRGMGVRVVQDEAFFVEPKLEDATASLALP